TVAGCAILVLVIRTRSTPFVVLLLGALAGCESPRRSHQEDVRVSYPPPEGRRTEPPVDKEGNPDSQVWPLDLWLVEFGKRNGVELRYRDRDVFDKEVVRP